MMRNALAAFILLTLLDGKPVWVESTAVTIIREGHAQCAAANVTAIKVGSNALCVKETSEMIRQKIQDAEGVLR